MFLSMRFVNIAPNIRAKSAAVPALRVLRNSKRIIATAINAAPPFPRTLTGIKNGVAKAPQLCSTPWAKPATVLSHISNMPILLLQKNGRNL